MRKQSKVFYGWWIVIASTSIMLYSTGIVNYGFTAVFEPIAEEFKWSYAQISFGASLRGIGLIILVPLIGLLVDWWGSRILVFSGSVLLALGLFMLIYVSSLGMFYGAFILIAIGFSGCIGTVFVSVITNWFRKRVGLAIGVLTAGTGFSGLLVPIMTVLIDTLKWRRAMLSLSLGTLAIHLPLALLIRHKPEQYGYLPDGELKTAEETDKSITSTTNVEDISAKQALKDRAFWHMR